MRALVIFLLVLSCAVSSGAQAVVLHAQHDEATQHQTEQAAVPALQQVNVSMPVRLTEADHAHRGEVWLEVSAEENAAASPKLTLRLPLSSTEDVYGEARACKVGANGALQLTFTAGMDVSNYVGFTAAEKDKQISLLLNKYLCRAMAAPFLCDGKPIKLDGDWSKWSLGSRSVLQLSSDAPATLKAGEVKVQSSGQSFDPATCAVIAPSSGMCCVDRRATQWHCGGTPTGEGWHQVSGECFHRETGASCYDGGPLQLPSSMQLH